MKILLEVGKELDISLDPGRWDGEVGWRGVQDGEHM